MEIWGDRGVSAALVESADKMEGRMVDKGDRTGMGGIMVVRTVGPMEDRMVAPPVVPLCAAPRPVVALPVREAVVAVGVARVVLSAVMAASISGSNVENRGCLRVREEQSVITVGVHVLPLLPVPPQVPPPLPVLPSLPSLPPLPDLPHPPRSVFLQVIAANVPRVERGSSMSVINRNV